MIYIYHKSTESKTKKMCEINPLIMRDKKILHTVIFPDMGPLIQPFNKETSVQVVLC